MVHRIEELKRAVQERCPEYGELLAEGMAPADADRALAERGAVSENDLLAIYSRVLGVEPFDEENFRQPERFDGISEEYLVNQELLPYRWDDETFELLAASPYEWERQAYELNAFFGRQVTFKLARRSLIERMTAKVYQEAEEEEERHFSGDDEHKLRQLAGEAKIVRLVNEMLSQALERNASDIHVEPEETQLVIRFRIDGVLHEYLSLPLSDYPAIASRIKLIGALNIAESRLPQDGRTNFQIGRREIDIRISTIPIMNGESIVMRLLRKDAMKFDLRELGMNETLLGKFEELISIPHGILLVVGPTGSGKTTTLYSVMQQLNDRKRKIITVEDPVEYQLPGLSQMQVNPKIGLSFASGLRHIVRQDPDVILVGEIRDRETADIAINAALTGHLVLSTLHTNDAVGAITRLSDMGVEGFLVASALFGVLSQRLVRRVCPHCRGAGSGPSGRCRNCGGSGYRGRTGIYELLRIDDELRGAIVAKRPSGEINEIARRNGMIPLLEDGQSKVEQGITTEAELLRIAAGV